MSVTPRLVVRLLPALVVCLLAAACGRRGPTAPPSLDQAMQTIRQRAESSGAADDWVDLARAELKVRNWPAAAEAYQQALAIDPDHLPALGELAGLRLAHHERAAAEALIAKIDLDHGESTQAQMVLGELYSLLQKPELSAASYAKALRLDPQDPTALEQAGRLALRDGDLQRADALLRRLQAVSPNAPSTKLLQLSVAQSAGRYAEVEQLLRGAHKTQPTPESRAMLASYYLSRGQPAEALAVDEQWLKSHPEDGSAILAKAEALRQLERDDDALRLLRQAAAAKRPDPRVNLDLAKMLMGAGQMDEAETELREVLRRAPLDSGLRLRVAQLYGQYDQTRAAAEILDQLQRDDPRYTADVRAMMADLAQQADLDIEAGDPIESSYLYALSRQPDNVRVLNNLAFHYAQVEKRLDAAQDLIERAAALIQSRGGDPEQDPVLLDTRAWIRFRQKDYQGAWRDLQAAWAKQPDDPLLAWHRAAVLNALGRRPEAKTMAQKALADRGKFVGRRECERLLESFFDGGASTP